MAAAVAVFLLGFLAGLLALALAEGAALLCFIRSLARRPKPAPPPEPDAQLTADDPPPPFQKQGYLWVLEQDKTPKVVSANNIKERRNIVEVFPLKMLARLDGHSLALSGPDGSQITIRLLDCTVLAVSASNLPSRKWAKRYPIRLESKESEICNGSKVCYVYAGTSWEKESWCKALRLASTTDKEKLKKHAALTQQFRAYISSLSAGYPCFLKPSVVFSGEEQHADKAVKPDGSSKVRLFLRKFSKKTSVKYSQASKTSPALSSKQNMKQSSTPSYSLGYNSRVSTDSPDANVNDKLVDEGTLCWNLLFSRLFFDAQMNDDLQKAIKARIQQSLSNMRTASYIGEITLTDLSLGKLPPCIRGMRVPPLDLNELWAFEVDFEYSSGILLHVATRIEVQEPELQNDIMKTTLEDDSNGVVNSDLLDSIEHYGKQVRSAQDLASAVEDTDEADALRRSKSTGWTYMSRWKNLVHSIADHVSQVPLSLAIKISSVRGTMRIHIKPPPSDRIWYGFTSMPELEWELESSVGDRKITNSHIASLIGNRIKASLHQTFVLPNCESVPISWMISDKEDWVPRKVAPFIWLNREPTETASHTAEKTTSMPQLGEAAASKAILKSRASKSSPPDYATTTIDESPKNTAIVVHGSNQEPAAESSSQWLSLVSASKALQSDNDANGQLRMPLLSSREFQEDDDASEDGAGVGSSLDRAMVVAAGKQPLRDASAEAGEDGKRKRGRRARVMDLGRRVGGKLEEKRRHMEEKGKHIVDKLRENARSDGLPDLERATTAPPADDLG